jgi:diacylglycerol kinase (ATP)
MPKKFSIKAHLASFKNAWRGLTVFIRQEQNGWIHCTMTVLVIIAGFLFRISTAEWIAVFFAIGLVLAAEAINSAVAAAFVGIIIFLPKLLFT